MCVRVHVHMLDCGQVCVEGGEGREREIFSSCGQKEKVMHGSE